MPSQEILDKLNYIEQVYFSLDEPVPIKNDLKCYPVLVKDYFKFYSTYGCLTMDKTTKEEYDENGMLHKVPDIEGLKSTYLTYLIRKMSDKKGGNLAAQVMELFELVFHIPKGYYCPNCGKIIPYSEALSGMEEYVNDIIEQTKKAFEDNTTDEEREKNQETFNCLLEQIKLRSQYDYLNSAQKCPDCESEMRDVFSIDNSDNDFPKFLIKDTIIGDEEFELLQALIPRQNILDYDDDKYMDSELKEELKIKSQMQNEDYTSPSLEKQIACVAIGMGYKLEYLYEIPMRKLSLLLRLIDRRDNYCAQYQASMSGFVEFKTPPQHWIFSEDKKNIAKELTSMNDFTKKFDNVT